ncbi:MAG: DUF167 domain-containing protein [Parvularculaceae bacterium]
MAGADIRIRVNPGASRTVVGGLWQGPDGERRLVVRVSAPPDKGKANKAVTAAVAKAFGLPKSAVSITAGDKDRLKTLRLEADAANVTARLEHLWDK